MEMSMIHTRTGVWTWAIDMGDGHDQWVHIVHRAYGEAEVRRSDCSIFTPTELYVSARTSLD